MSWIRARQGGLRPGPGFAGGLRRPALVGLAHADAGDASLTGAKAAVDRDGI